MSGNHTLDITNQAPEQVIDGAEKNKPLQGPLDIFNSKLNAVVLTDKTSLTTLITEVQGLTQTHYTSGTWGTLQTALTSAIVVKDNANATQEQINMSLNYIILAKNDLVLKGDRTMLNKLVDSTKELIQNNYTEQSWKKLEIALEMTNNDDISESRINFVHDYLQGAINNLEAITQV